MDQQTAIQRLDSEIKEGLCCNGDSKIGRFVRTSPRRSPLEPWISRHPQKKLQLAASKSYTCLDAVDGQYEEWKADDKITGSTPCLYMAEDDAPSCNPPDHFLPLIRTVRYQNFRVKVYKGVQQPEKMYYYEPIVMLVPQSIDSRAIVTCPTGQAYVRFVIQMWNDEVQKCVVDRLRKSSAILLEDDDDVQVMPYEEVRLVMKKAEYNCWNDVTVPGNPTTYHQLDQALEFYFLCPSKEAADMLAKEMRANPGFSTRHLALECKGLSFSTEYEDSKKASPKRMDGETSSIKPYSIMFSLHVASSSNTANVPDPAVVQPTDKSSPSRLGKYHWTEGVLKLCDALQRRLDETEILCQSLQEQMDKQTSDLKRVATLGQRKTAVPVFSANRLQPTTGSRKYVAYCDLEFESNREYGVFDKEFGMFTANVGGLYLFLFNGLNWNRAGGTRVELRVGGISRASSYARDPGQTEQNLLVISAIVKLNKGDQVGIYLERGLLCDGAPQYTRFSGIFFDRHL